MAKVELIPIFDDNYVFLIINQENSEAILVDPGKASETIKIIEQKDLKLTGVLITHHHPDHIDGLTEVKKRFKVPVYAPVENKNRIQADTYVTDREQLKISTFAIQIIALPGHTLGHKAYWFPEQKWLFSGDVLFGLGCGRIFDGSFEQAYESLQKIKSLPPETQVFCTHEYTEINLRFCKNTAHNKTEDFKNYEKELQIKRNSGVPSVPLTLSVEKKVNPFLLADTLEDFINLRKLRNQF